MIPEDINSLLSVSLSDTQCACSYSKYRSWTDVSKSDMVGLEKLGSLCDGDYAKCTSSKLFSGNYWHENYPISLKHYPQVESDVYRCSKCGRIFLSYTELSGHFQMKRLRWVRYEIVT